jgi:hypothetical protein
VSTLWGVALPVSLRVPAAGMIVLALAGLVVRRDGSGRGDLGEIGRMVALALPLLWVMADVLPSQPDALLAFVPKAAYLWDYGHFPVQAGPPVFTDVPVAPYSTELVSLLGSLAGGGFAANGPALFTVLLHLAAGLMLARALAGDRRPGWVLTAVGLALATGLNPGFVPRVSFAGYGEAPLAVALLVAGWLTVRVMDDLAAGIRWPQGLLPLALTLAVMIGIKQQAAGLMVAYGGGVVAALMCAPRIGAGAAARTFAVVALPAGVLFLAWRGYVAAAYPDGELKALPLSQWVWGALPGILHDMGRVVVHQPAYFLAVAAVALLLLRPPRGLADGTRRVLVLTAVAFVLYNGFLLLTFVGHFREEHSFFRYNSHLSLLVVLGLALAARDALAARSGGLGRVHRLGGRLAVAAMLAAPLAAAPLLRFDRDMPQPRLRLVARDLAGELQPDARIALILPGDNGSVADQLGALLRFAPPRRPRLDLWTSAAAAPSALPRAVAAGYRTALLSCTDGSGLDLPADAAALLAWTGDAWVPVRVWPYPPLPKRTWWNWTGMLAGEPFCIR